MMQRMSASFAAVAVAAMVLAVNGCKEESPQPASSKPVSKTGDQQPASKPTGDTMASPTAATPVNKNEVAVLETKYGKMVIEFFNDDAPNTIANFKKLAKQGFYDGTAFHRIMKGFMIQGGDPNSKDPNQTNLGSGGPGYQIKAEFNKNRHVLGVVSMARAQNPDSAGSQFFICLGDATFLDGQYTAFGKLIGGVDALQKIGEVPVKPNPYSQEPSVPTVRVQLDKVTIVGRDQVTK
jgi:peptidyl-prolyl cis-trans isomerase B (cyclophilin B)